MALNLTNDMDIFDYLQSGAFYVRAAGDTFTPHTGIKCLRRVVRKGPKSATAALIQEDTAVWHIKKADMDSAGLTPRFLDRIKDDTNTYWFIRDYTLETLGTRYRCNTTRVKN